MNLTDSQTIFTIFYALYFPVTVPLFGILRPFDTPSMCKFKCDAWLRFIISLILVDLIPLLYFVIIFSGLADIYIPKSFFPLLFFFIKIFFLSIAGFGFYRLYAGIMLIKIKGKYFFYENGIIPKQISEELGKRGDPKGECKVHLLPGLIWILITIIIAIYWFCC